MNIIDVVQQNIMCSVRKRWYRIKSYILFETDLFIYLF
jgi:uncharacterized protein YbaR (Trm112 family)